VGGRPWRHLLACVRDWMAVSLYVSQLFVKRRPVRSIAAAEPLLLFIKPIINSTDSNKRHLDYHPSTLKNKLNGRDWERGAGKQTRENNGTISSYQSRKSHCNPIAKSGILCQNNNQMSTRRREKMAVFKKRNF